MQQEIDYARLGAKIKELRQQKGLTQDNLAEMIGCNTSHISNIENNYTKLSLNALLGIANSLNTSVDHLLSDQYENRTLALDNEIARAVGSLDIDNKERLLRIIHAL